MAHHSGAVRYVNIKNAVDTDYLFCHDQAMMRKPARLKTARDNYRYTSVRLPKELDKALRDAAALVDRSVNYEIVRRLRESLEREKTA